VDADVSSAVNYSAGAVAEDHSRAAGQPTDEPLGLATTLSADACCTWRPAHKEAAMNANLEELARTYVRTWDARAEDGLVDEVMAPDVVDHHPVGAADGVAGVKRDIAAYHAAFPDLSLACEDYLIAGDRVAVRWSATGTHEGDGLGIPPTHRHVELHGIDILRVVDGRVAERWGEFNGLDMMQQLTGSRT
jgi:predicted ester cyclase